MTGVNGSNNRTQGQGRFCGTMMAACGGASGSFLGLKLFFETHRSTDRTTDAGAGLYHKGRTTTSPTLLRNCRRSRRAPACGAE